MIIHFKKDNGELNAGKFCKKIPGGRTCFDLMDGCSMQIDDEKIVAQFDESLCWRCWNTRKIYAKAKDTFFECPACKYRPKYDESFKETIEQLGL